MDFNSEGSGLDINYEISDALETPVAEPTPAPAAVEPVVPAATVTDDPIPTPAPAAKVEPVVELPADEPAAVDDSLVGEIIGKFGYDFDEDFEDSTEGLVAATKAIGERLADETLDALFDAHPTIKAHFEFVRNGGDPNKFFGQVQAVDYRSLELDKDKPDPLKDVIRTYLKEKGNDDGFINDMIEAYEDKQVLFEKAEAAKNALAGSQDAQRNAMLENQRKQMELERAEAEKTWNTVRETVTKAPDLAGLPITEKDRGAFIRYISAPVTKDGRTQRDLDAAQLTLDKQLALDYLLYKKLDMKGFIGTKAKTQAATNLRDRLSADQRVRGNSQHAKSSPDAIDDVEFDNLL